jgi:hypothetical protein
VGALALRFSGQISFEITGDRNAMRTLTLPKSLCLAKVTHRSCCTDAACNCARITGNSETSGLTRTGDPCQKSPAVIPLI